MIGSSNEKIDNSCQIREAAEGVWYIHSEGIVHGDLRGVSISLFGNDYNCYHLPGKHSSRC